MSALGQIADITPSNLDVRSCSESGHWSEALECLLSPTLVQAAVDGRLPRGVGVATVRDFPAEWTRQYKRLGLFS